MVCRTDWKELNDMLQLMKRRCSEVIIDMMNEGKLDIGAIPGLLKDRMVQDKTFLDYARSVAEVRYRKLTDRSIKHYEQFFRYMEEWKGIVYFADGYSSYLCGRSRDK